MILLANGFIMKSSSRVDLPLRVRSKAPPVMNSHRYASIAVYALLTIQASLADGALVQSFQMTGQLGLEVTAAAGGNMHTANGSLSLNNVVGVPVQAYLYATDWQSGSSPYSGTFNGAPLVGPVTQSDTTLPGISYTHRWDVTSMIVGPGSYSYSFSGLMPGANQNFPNGSILAGVGLAVVYNDPTANANTIVTIIDGSQQLGEGLTISDTESVTFNNLVAGSTTIHSFTVFDDNAESGEVVRYNGNPIGGPIDQSLGLNATLLTMSGTSISGANTLSLTTDPATPNVDHMHWVLAASSVAPVPEPRAWALMILAAAMVVIARWTAGIVC